MNSDAGNFLPLVGFFAKKIVSLLLYPLGMVLVLLIAGMLVWRRKPLSRWSFALVSTGAILLLVASMPITARLLLEPLELAAGNYCDPEMLRERGVRHIVVLVGSVVLPDLSPADSLGPLVPRVMEGIRLATALPTATLVLSGGCLPHIESDPEAMAVLPVQSGVAPERLVVKIGALDTADEARMLSRIVGSEPFALVTSATHVNRAARLFQQQGTHPIPCPCARRVWREGPWYSWILPNATSLKETTDAVHEYIGDVWARIRR